MGTLSDTNFTVDGVEYYINAIRGGTPGTGATRGNLFLRLSNTIPEADWKKLTLHVGTATFALPSSRDYQSGMAAIESFVKPIMCSWPTSA